ncbi:CDP-6-deoxy-delta-3,4-glucoseen reductase [Diaphorobacter nitroreducens]|uniref:CDP-6-deoxy-delta-3,4-glucoseen reductase n=1 Tax=Diaphorobacter TaxID=238749 RepID=UPI0000DC91A8|nr:MULTISPECIES: CDP-6-deoxy-delta-3,4-glucoseen reductase [Diaphorobacter]ABM43122.1 oxidoreductase FAD/NAD(P)-binding domain protein [Acidovorax sp. JS42]ASI67391.1 CDP-6-deoxy-delta-3,4-glucoseen reductase [Diaphorobacter nitroreducens]KLR57576.1 CDP-6-deoxy-delta-3,4-glucoseen reductase [Diaphorobacter sp. J5-51]MBV2216624.1 CDP-6-deoxy-delta-3,4-glucoseen reductase [Diaphorobacter sp.]QJY33819.1 CDP-6-deoxy-delta-3,4-glucoseen reductase [Diaphorobacter sp. JS3050]
MTSAETAFQITVQPSGRAFEAQAGETILSAAIRGGVGMPYGCKDGACGSCKCKKLSGSVVHGEHQQKALSTEEEEAGFVLTCCAQPLTDVVLESRQVTDESAYPIKKLPVRVAALTRASHDVMQVRLQLPAADTFRYHAGQYIEFILRDGARRAYSMANAPHTQEGAPGVELHIRHMPGGRFTDHVFNAMKEKEILRVEGPFGSFFLREDSDKPMVFLASGTGFAPIKALIEHMQHKGITRPATLYWGGRRPADLYMDGWIRERLAALPNLRYVPVVSDALPEDGWAGRTGFVHQAVMEDIADLSGYQVYACGAPIVVDSARAAYSAERGLPPDEFYADAFTSEADKHGG